MTPDEVELKLNKSPINDSIYFRRVIDGLGTNASGNFVGFRVQFFY